MNGFIFWGQTLYQSSCNVFDAAFAGWENRCCPAATETGVAFGRPANCSWSAGCPIGSALTQDQRSRSGECRSKTSPQGKSAVPCEHQSLFPQVFVSCKIERDRLSKVENDFLFITDNRSGYHQSFHSAPVLWGRDRYPPCKCHFEGIMENQSSIEYASFQGQRRKFNIYKVKKVTEKLNKK